MPYAEELTALAAEKRAVRARIGAHRAQCADAVRALLHPLSGNGHAPNGGFWNAVPGLAKSIGIPVGAAIGKRFVSGLADPARVANYVPLLVRAARWFGRRRGAGKVRT
jgi:hypothetical protein